MSEVARSILTTAILYRMTDEVKILLEVDLEWWYCPVALWLLWLLVHIEHLIVCIKNYNTCALEFLDGWLIVAHNAGAVLCLCKFHKL